MARGSRGFTLLETLIALSLVSVSMTGLVVALGSSSKFGALARRQATAMTVARSQAATLSHAPYPTVAVPTILSDTNPGNNVNASFGDPNARFASATTPTGNDSPDASLGQIKVGSEPYDVFLNVRPVADPSNALVSQGTEIAVIVRYKIGAQWMRAVAIAYRYNPTALGVADALPL